MIVKDGATFKNLKRLFEVLVRVAHKYLDDVRIVKSDLEITRSFLFLSH